MVMPLIIERKTLRKSLIAEEFAARFEEQPVLLEELRWAVLAREYEVRGRHVEHLSRANLNSFARTIREHFGMFGIKKLPIRDELPVGLLARAGVYRIKERHVLEGFLAAKRATVVCRYTQRQQASDPRYYKNRWATPYHHAVTLRFLTGECPNPTIELLQGIPGTYIPATRPLSVVCKQEATPIPERMCSVPWALVGYTTGFFYDVEPVSPLRCISDD